MKEMTLVREGAQKPQPLALKKVWLEMPSGEVRLIAVVALAEDADPMKGFVSKKSPLGKALIAGENSYKLPSGEEVPIKIIGIEETNNGRPTK